ncbi:MAG TPA: DUF2783 domain-containing protein [Candidatus Cybelea sp.]|nr:DUF2783 domain-containing protein [Candidatus Cybelea sp.]
MALRTDLNLSDPDGLYEALVSLHEGLSEAESAKLNAKLVLLLANHIGDEAVLREAMQLARKAVAGDR